MIQNYYYLNWFGDVSSSQCKLNYEFSVWSLIGNSKFIVSKGTIEEYCNRYENRLLEILLTILLK